MRGGPPEGTGDLLGRGRERDTRTRKCHLKTRKDCSCLQARKRALTGTEAAGIWILDSQPPEL